VVEQAVVRVEPLVVAVENGEEVMLPNQLRT
jgi:hypothetical protein